MSDTLQEGEDQMSTERIDQIESKNADWCDDCHSYTHMPWCPSYEPAVDDKELYMRPTTTSHQPAARGGGESGQRFTYVVVSGRYKVLDHLEQIATADGYDEAELIVKGLNQHQSLVAEREQWERDRQFLGDRLEAQAETVAKVVKERNQYRLALEIIRDSFWSEDEPFEERVEFLQQTAKDILMTVNEQRSTSE